MSDGRTQLSERNKRRLDDLQATGVDVVGPTQAEDTAGHAADPGEEGADVVWTVALSFQTPAGDSEMITGNGPTPDAAAEVALQRLSESARPTTS